MPNIKLSSHVCRRTISKGPSNSWLHKEGNGLQGKWKAIDFFYETEIEITHLGQRQRF